MRYFLRRRIPDIERILLVESGSREVVEAALPALHALFGADTPIDVVTCYAGLPAGCPESTVAWRVSDYAGAAARGRLYTELRARSHSVCGIVCSGEPIMTKWKWSIAARVPSKIFIINENGDFFWVDRGQWRIVTKFALLRAGLSGGGAVRLLVRLFLFPFTIVFLLLFAAKIHLQRKLRKAYG